MLLGLNLQISCVYFGLDDIEGSVDYGGNAQCQGQAFLLRAFRKQNTCLQQLFTIWQRSFCLQTVRSSGFFYVVVVAVVFLILDVDDE